MAFVPSSNSQLFVHTPSRFATCPRRPRTPFISSPTTPSSLRRRHCNTATTISCKSDDENESHINQSEDTSDNEQLNFDMPNGTVIPQRRTTASPTVDDERDDDEDQFVDTFDDNTPSSSKSIVNVETEPEVCLGEFMYSRSLVTHVEQRKAGTLQSSNALDSVWADAWALAVDARRGFELKNQYSRVGILMEYIFSDFEPAEGCKEAFRNATIEEIALVKARAVYEGTGLPCIAEMTDMSIDPPESGSRINKSLQQGYYTRNVAEEADVMLDRVRPISDENRPSRFNSVAVYYDGENEVITSNTVSVAMIFSSAAKANIASACALDALYKELTRKFGLRLNEGDGAQTWGNAAAGGKKGKVMIGATLLRERILREAKVLGDGIIKVSSFLNHMVDTDLMEVCGEELAARLRHTMPNKVLTVESTGLIAGLPTARRLGIPLVFARKSRPITISDSYQTTYRSSTKGVTSELIVSCEYLESGDRVLIIDDFLAGGSTAEGLFKLAKMAHAKVVGVGVLIEKLSDGGRTFLSGYDVPVESLAKVSADGEKGSISVMEEEPWTPPKSKMNESKVREKAMRAKAKYYSRTEEEAVVDMDEQVVVEKLGRRMDVVDNNVDKGDGDDDVDDVDEENEFVIDEDDEDGDDEVKVIRWEDDDVLDEIEDDLVRRS